MGLRRQFASKYAYLPVVNIKYLHEAYCKTMGDDFVHY